MFGTVLIVVCTSMHVYVVWRAATVPPIKGRVGPKWIFAVGLLLWLVFYLGRVYGHGGTGEVAGFLEFWGMTWMGVLFLSATALLAADLATGFGLLFRRRAPFIRSAALFSGLAVSSFAFIQGAAPPLPERHEVELPGLPPELNDTRLVAVADLHLGSGNNDHRLESLLEAVGSENPDMVVFVGDMFEGHGVIGDDVVSALKGIRAPLGKWAVLGNHESHGDKDVFARIAVVAQGRYFKYRLETGSMKTEAVKRAPERAWGDIPGTQLRPKKCYSHAADRNALKAFRTMYRSALLDISKGECMDRREGPQSTMSMP